SVHKYGNFGVLSAYTTFNKVDKVAKFLYQNARYEGYYSKENWGVYSCQCQLDISEPETNKWIDLGETEFKWKKRKGVYEAKSSDEEKNHSSGSEDSLDPDEDLVKLEKIEWSDEII